MAIIIQERGEAESLGVTTSGRPWW